MKRARITLTLCITLLGFAGLALAQDSKSASGAKESKAKGGPVAGTWTCTAHGGTNGDIPFTLYLEQDHETVTGSVSSSMGDAEFSSASFKDGALEIHIDGGDQSYVLTAKLQNGQLSGQWSGGGTEKGTWEGKKGSDAPTSN
ncbi:MAG TPA: hypothetical protein VMT20_14335 [Terriglobia bacterium]|nr:hypothetical protein [Terriglobia bacterium]